MHASPSRRRHAMRALSRGLLPVIAAVGLAGCMSAPKIPELARIDEVFPQAPADAEYAAIPPQAVSTAVYEAPFEDVFRLAGVSASQAQLNVERVDAQGGLILATRATMRAPGTLRDGQELFPHRYFYAIRVKELAGRRTEVKVAAKIQGSCRMGEGKSTRALMGVASLGLTEMLGAGGVFGDDKACKEVATPRWATGLQSSGEELANFQTFLRNNLLAQGLI